MLMFNRAKHMECNIQCVIKLEVGKQQNDDTLCEKAFKLIDPYNDFKFEYSIEKFLR